MAEMNRAVLDKLRGKIAAQKTNRELLRVYISEVVRKVIAYPTSIRLRAELVAARRTYREIDEEISTLWQDFEKLYYRVRSDERRKQ